MLLLLLSSLFAIIIIIGFDYRYYYKYFNDCSRKSFLQSQNAIQFSFAFFITVFLFL